MNTFLQRAYLGLVGLFLSLPIIVVAGVSVNEKQTLAFPPQGFSLATDVADWLVRQGVPFRDAHEISGALVRACEQRGIGLEDASDEVLADVSPHLDPAVRDVLTIEGSVASRSGAGGTAGERVTEQRSELIARAQDAAHALGL